MPGKIDGIKPPFVPIGGVEGIPSRQPVAPAEGASDFRDILLEKISREHGIKFSAHAQTRVQSRNLPLDGENLEKLVQAVDQAQRKGAHDSLILLNDMAFIVNVDNRTVITAMDNEGLKENVFTNIDSAVIMK